MSRPNFSRERKAIALGKIVCGIDEAGRGPLAGPVVAAAVVLDPKNLIKGLNDSKQLSGKARHSLFELITSQAQYGIGIVEADEIDRINILQATFVAMKKAFAALSISPTLALPTLALIDGNRAPPLSCAVETIIKGDGKCMSIAAASIIAKVTRDRLMLEHDKLYPQYGFSNHKGYGTEAHLVSIAHHGPCPLHRMSFSPIKLDSGTQQLDLNLTD
jgi:ribonuclease HII